MTAAGWVFMILSVGSVTYFFGWCLWKVFTKKETTSQMHGMLDEQVEIEKTDRP